MSGTKELLETRLKRFLHYGSEQPIYKAGDRFHQKCYTKSNVPSLIKLISEENPESIVDILLKVKKEETSVWPDAITFALVICAHQNESVALQNAAYKAIRTICQTARDIILFVKFYREMKEHDGTSKGGGSGFKRAIAHWYLVWMPFDLADIFLHQKGYYGWKHIDVLRLAHVKPVSIEQQVLFLYAAKGLKEVQTKFGESTNEQVIELIEYLTTVESFKKISDPEKAAGALALELHNIERVPPPLLKFQEVWNELIPHMDVKTLLDNFQRISILGLLKNNNVTVMKVVDVLNNLWKAETFKGHPTRVFIELMTYEKAASYCLEIANKMGHPISKITPARKPPKCNLLLKNALSTFFYSLFKFQKPTNLRYLVAVDVRPKMFSDRCHCCLHLSPIEAAEAITLSLVRTEPETLCSVTVGAFVDTKGVLEIIPFSKKQEISEYASSFKSLQASPGPASVAAAVHWAELKKHKVDVFLILSNYSVCTHGTRQAINKYRQEMSLPNTKLITCSLSGNIRTHKDVEGTNMMCIVGFDQHVCRVIEAFACGAF